MRFIDQAKIILVAGDGGSGMRHFRREKFVPRGGPDGGDGGRGGDVIVEASTRSRSLLNFHHRKIHKAENGEHGSTSRKTGRSGEHLVLTVPLGTELYDDETGERISDLVAEGQRFVVAVGGNGGWGNVHFKSSKRQSPDRANAGLPGQERTVRLELKLLADIALVGLPNAGKSTLIRTISAAKAEVADYPFTTLTPNLGVVQHGDRTFTVADVPGLIAGAADGAGLGAQFLRHIERCRALVYLLMLGDEVSPGDQWRILRAELGQHDPALIERPSIIVLSKADVVGPDLGDELDALKQDIGRVDVLPLSATSRTGISQLLDTMVLHALATVEEAAPPWDPLESL